MKSLMLVLLIGHGVEEQEAFWIFESLALQTALTSPIYCSSNMF